MLTLLRNFLSFGISTAIKQRDSARRKAILRRVSEIIFCRWKAIILHIQSAFL